MLYFVTYISRTFSVRGTKTDIKGGGKFQIWETAASF
jgi:hypothetical protein